MNFEHFAKLIGVEYTTIETKICSECGLEKPLTSFRNEHHFSKTPFYRSECYDCDRKMKALMKELKKTAPPKPEVCDLCGEKTDIFFLDHCHKTNTFRGWVCRTCNLGISFIFKNEKKGGSGKDAAQRLMDYLCRGV